MRCVNCWMVQKPDAPTVGGCCLVCAAIVRGRRAAVRYAEALRAAEVRRAATVERREARRYGWAWSPAGVDNWTRQTPAPALAVEDDAGEGTPADEREERRLLRAALLELSEVVNGGGEDWVPA